MRPDTQRHPAGSGEPVRDPARAAALHRLATATAGTPPRSSAAGAAPTPDGAAPAPDSSGPASAHAIPWMDTDADGRRPPREPAPPTEAAAFADAAAWADPPWWQRIRWAPDRIAGVALVVLVIGLGAFSVHQLMASVPDGPSVPDLPMVEPGDPAATEGAAAPTATSTAPGPGPDPAAAGGDPGRPGADPADAAEPVVVSVVGLVARSGLVTLTPGARVADALEHAGGVLEGGDRNGLNLARKLVDGEQILVGVAPDPNGPQGARSAIIGADGGPAPASPGPVTAGGTGTAADGPVDLNAADAAGLEALPGVGPVTASAILGWRTANGPFTSVDQLTEVDGIGPATMDRLRPLVTV